jgi:hypothetical protein
MYDVDSAHHRQGCTVRTRPIAVKVVDGCKVRTRRFAVKAANRCKIWTRRIIVEDVDG